MVTQAGAVPAAYAENRPDQFSYIHFVAHGTASRLSPLDSAVVLSAPAGHPESFKLYARDIMRYPLHAKLVTISACYGSGLRAYAGEGLVGLSWAFLRAGSHNVIGALWEVNDASTPLLMDRLYGELEAGSTPDAAPVSYTHLDVYKRQVLCSLVDGVDRAIPGRSFGHVVEIPDFGRIFLGELLACRHSIQLSLIRAELGCGITGQTSGPTAAVRGVPYPP